MHALTISISEERMAQLREKAALFKVPPEELLRLSLEELLTGPDERLRQALEYVLQKNSELYRRLGQPIS